MKTLVQNEFDTRNVSGQELTDGDLAKVTGGVSFEYGALVVTYTKQTADGGHDTATSGGKR
jgi:hypothetical protein